MSLGKLAVIGIALVLAGGGIGSALADRGGPDFGGALELAQLDDARKDELAEAVELASAERDDDDTGDGDRTRGNDGTDGGNNTGDGDRTRGNDGTDGGNNTGDGDNTGGNDGTNGGNNTGGGGGAGGGGGTSGGGTDDGGT